MSEHRALSMFAPSSRSGEENRKGDNAPDNRVKKIMEKLDLNDDKQISRDEFVDGCLKDDVLRQLLAPNV